MAKMVYFTNSFPYGIGEDWKYTEISNFAKYFDDIVIAPLAFNGNHTARQLPSEIKVLMPLFESEGLKTNILKIFRTLILNPIFILYLLKELKNLRSVSNLKSLLVDFEKIDRIKNAGYFKSHVLPEAHGALLFFFWGKGYADVLPFLPKKLQDNAVVRFHGYDLYKERNNGYVPCQEFIVKSARMVLAISEHGLKYLQNNYSACNDKMHLSLLGTTGNGLSRYSKDDVLRIVSCAFLSPVKRIHLIPEALALLNEEIEWTHIGGGDDITELKNTIASLPSNIKVHLKGDMKPSEITKFYASNEFDVFLNVSESEGMPVSIMEALSAGIPVIATDAGGTREIVDNEVGKLLPVKLTPEKLALELSAFKVLPKNEKEKLRHSGFIRFQNRLQAATQAQNLAKQLLDIL